MKNLNPSSQEKPSLRRIIRALWVVACAFFGVRNSAEFDTDSKQLSPLVVIIVGLCAALLFVLGLVALVTWVVGSGIAQSH